MFRLTVDDVFSIRGRGTVVTGHIEEGAVTVGDEVRINDAKNVRVDGIEAFRKVLDHAEAGANVGLLFAKLDRSQVMPGDVITGLGSASEPLSPAAPASGRDPHFAEAEEQRTQFVSMREAGLMDDAQMDESLRVLTFSAGGRQWMLKADSDDWYSSADGKVWKRDTPPA